MSEATSGTLWAADFSLVPVVSKRNLAINLCYKEHQRKLHSGEFGMVINVKLCYKSQAREGADLWTSRQHSARKVPAY